MFLFTLCVFYINETKQGEDKPLSAENQVETEVSTMTGMERFPFCTTWRKHNGHNYRAARPPPSIHIHGSFGEHFYFFVEGKVSRYIMRKKTESTFWSCCSTLELYSEELKGKIALLCFMTVILKSFQLILSLFPPQAKQCSFTWRGVFVCVCVSGLWPAVAESSIRGVSCFRQRWQRLVLWYGRLGKLWLRETCLAVWINP